MKKRLLTFVLMLSLLVAVGSCEATKTVNPETGETEKTYALDQEQADEIESATETLVAAGGIASGFLPWLTPFVAATVAGLATWRKIRPKLNEATAERDAFFKGGEVLAIALDDIKTNQPEVWAKIAPVIEDAAGPVGHVENAIRGFRHLPPK